MDGDGPDGVSVVETESFGRWQRNVVATPWVSADHDLVALVACATRPHLSDGATQIVVVTEKVVSIAAGLAVDTEGVHVGRLATVLSKRIRPRGDSLALAVPVKMQWVIDRVGRPRIIAAAVASAITRPFGVTGAFYAIAGRNARSVDGVRGEYPRTLLPPLDPRQGREWVRRLEQRLECPVAIIDYNDRGGSVRACGGATSKRQVASLVADNPLGSRDESTPVAVLTKLP